MIKSRERRKHPRTQLTYHLPLNLALKNKTSVHAHCKDISKSGIKIAGKFRIEKGGTIRIKPMFSGQDYAEEIVAQAVWSGPASAKDTYEYGLKFLHAYDKEIDKITTQV
ncbi:MAG: PilZ domain-containing protein [bacterium]|nr:PilZ domain-containing protein [bacterium]